MNLPPPQQAVQAAHACIEVARTLISAADEHPHLVLIGVASEERLLLLLAQLARANIRCCAFREPDFNDELTAVATEPVCGPQRKLFRKYQCLRASAAGFDLDSTSHHESQ